MSLSWEKIDDYIFRTKIPGGWLVKMQQVKSTFGPRGEHQIELTAGSITFVPDSTNTWYIK